MLGILCLRVVGGGYSVVRIYSMVVNGVGCMITADATLGGMCVVTRLDIKSTR